jgi:hypothetical protein
MDFACTVRGAEGDRKCIIMYQMSQPTDYSLDTSASLTVRRQYFPLSQSAHESQNSPDFHSPSVKRDPSTVVADSVGREECFHKGQLNHGRLGRLVD